MDHRRLCTDHDHGSLLGSFTAVTMVGFTTFVLLSFHMVVRGVLSTATVPVIYAAAMGADALVALASGWGYDWLGGKVLAALPLLAALAAISGFAGHMAAVLGGALLWGAAVGIQESTLRTVVADLVVPQRRASAYGIFAVGLGAAAVAGGALHRVALRHLHRRVGGRGDCGPGFGADRAGGVPAAPDCRLSGS